MSLLTRLSTTLPRQSHLETYERELALSERGPQVLKNFETSLQQHLISDANFERFCTKLSKLIPDPPMACDPSAIAVQIDSPEPFYCQGPQVQSNPGDQLSRVMELRGYLRASLRRRPSNAEYQSALHDWRLGRAGTYCHFTLRGPRPFCWATPTEKIQSAGPATSDRLRDLLGLSHYRQGFLLELRFATASNHPLYRPTVLDALDGASFYPAEGPDGWGMTDDLSGPRPTPGLPEAVMLMAELECDVTGRGDLTSPPRRF